MKYKLNKTFSINGEPYMNQRKYLKMPVKGNLYTMTPDTYINESAKILGMSYQDVINTRLRDHKSYSYISMAAEKGKLTIPVLDYINQSQDGLHRAMWAKQNGFKHIPVLIFGKRV